MKTGKLACIAGALVFALGGCENMSRQDAYTAGGATVGGALGSAVTDSSTVGTVGGAVAGGYLGRRLGNENE